MLADANFEGQPASPRARLTGAERRAAILEAAIQLFSQNGFRGTTTRQLAAAVGVSEPVLYQHFATKRELYDAIVDHLIEGTQAQFCQSLAQLGEKFTEREFFLWLGKLILEWYEQRPREVRLLLFSALEGHDLAQLWHQKAVSQFMEYVEACYERQVAAGTFVQGDALFSARAFICMVGHYGQTRILFPEHGLDLPAEQVVPLLVDLFLNGVRTR
ncbi:MAG: TetR/AcrR family transcriptional regulator [Acidobacteria bacterium]|nr:TetR/AcrR family transcriptional regulator [Acidobacteriota bacterium]